MSCLDIPKILTLSNLGCMIQASKINNSFPGLSTIAAKVSLLEGNAESLPLFFANKEPKETS